MITQNMYFYQKNTINKYTGMYTRWIDREYTLKDLDRNIMINKYEVAISKLSVNDLQKLNRNNYRKVLDLHV